MRNAHIVVVGGGPGGVTLANRLARAKDVDITLVDSHGRHLYQAGLLAVALEGGAAANHERDARELIHPRVRFVVGRARAVDTEARKVHLEDGSTLEFDWLVLATGARVNDAAIPGLREHGDHFHCTPAAERLREKIAAFQGGRVVVGIGGAPYKCPPVPVEFVLLFDDALRRRGLREATEITYVSPFEGVVQRPEVASAARPWLEEKGIRVRTSFSADHVEPGALVSKSNDRLEFDLLVLVPPHRPAPFVGDSGLAPTGGFVPVDKATLKVRNRVYAMGDTTDAPAPKTASAAQNQAPVVAQNLLDEIAGRPPSARYDGRVLCFMETGGRTAVRIEFDYQRPPANLERAPRWRWMKSLLHRYYFDLLRLGARFP